MSRARIAGEHGLALMAAGDSRGAERELVLSLEKFAKMQTHVTPTTAELRLALARLLLVQNRAAAALPLAREADEFWHGFAPEHPAARDAAQWHARCRNALRAAAR